MTPEADGGVETETSESDDGGNVTVNAFLPPQVPSSPVSKTEGQMKIGDALGSDRADLTVAEHEKLKAAVLDYANLFALSSFELGVTDLVSHSINTGDHPPVRQPPRRTPFSLRQKVTEMVQQMLTQGIVCPSYSPWASPVVLVQKKDGSLRFCVDYRRLNAITKLDVFPLLRIDDSLDLLAKSKYFTTLDLATGYWQVRMEPASQEKTAFVTHDGHYEFKVMPFGLTNAPATFQRLMEGVLHGLVGRCCLVYIDDIVVMGETFAEHVQNLRTVLERLKQANFKAEIEKMSIC